MNEGRTGFAQLLDLLPKYEFDKCVVRYHGNFPTVIIVSTSKSPVDFETRLNYKYPCLSDSLPVQAENRRLQRELHRVAQKRDILKNLGHDLRTTRRRFERIKAMQTECSIAELRGTLAVTRSSCHAWASREPGVRAKANAALLPLVTQAHRESRQTCGSPRINAAMESFRSSLKRELVHRRQFAARAEARAAIFEWIEVFYNRGRFHSAPGFKSPVDFETHLN